MYLYGFITVRKWAESGENMITKFIITLASFPFKTLMFLFSPRYFRSVTNLGKILKTNDNVFSTDGYSKSNRRVVVTDDDGKHIKVNKITSDKDYDPRATSKQRKKQRRFTTKIDYKKYPNALTKESVVDIKQYSINERTGKRLKITDRDFRDTGDKLTRSDMSNVVKKIRK